MIRGLKEEQIVRSLDLSIEQKFTRIPKWNGNVNFVCLTFLFSPSFPLFNLSLIGYQENVKKNIVRLYIYIYIYLKAVSLTYQMFVESES